MPLKNRKNSKIKKQFKTEEVKVFKQFRKQKIFNQITFVFAAFIMAFGINTFVLNGKMGKQLKTNILEAHTTIKKSDIYIEKNKNITQIKIGKDMDQVKSISFGLVYNPKSIEIQDIISKIDSTKLLKLENEKGITTIIINFKEVQTVKSGTNILDLYISKKLNKTTQHINIINSHFTDSTNTKYDLSTSGIIL